MTHRVDTLHITSLCVLLYLCESDGGFKISNFHLYKNGVKVLFTSQCIMGGMKDALLLHGSQAWSMMSYFPLCHRLDPGCLTPMCVVRCTHSLFLLWLKTATPTLSDWSLIRMPYVFCRVWIIHTKSTVPFTDVCTFKTGTARAHTCYPT